MDSSHSYGPLVELRGIRKCFGSAVALDGVDLDLAAGEIHALVGENGAGKSTLLKILSGVEEPDVGEIILDGRNLGALDPATARAFGIRSVPQELELFPQRSVAENCFGVAELPTRQGWLHRWGAKRPHSSAGASPPRERQGWIRGRGGSHARGSAGASPSQERGGWVDWREARRRAGEALKLLEISLPLHRPAAELTAPERALVQLAAALVHEPRVLLLDEPTASLGEVETQRLFEILRRLRAAGSSIVYVSHRLAEVLAIADRVTVLRDGRRVWTRAACEVDEAGMIEAMVGRRLDVYFPRPPEPALEVALAVDRLSDLRGSFRDIDLTLRRGEILGLYGIAGSGQSELAQALAGFRRASGTITARGAIAYVPGDRLTEGNLTGRSVRENITISGLSRLGSPFWIDRAAESSRAGRVREELGIACRTIEDEIETLSGGNQQKVLLARALSTEPDILILDEPTRGIDVGARAEIHRLMADLAGQGKAVFFISSDLPEVLGMSHRVAVLCQGRLSAVLPAAASGEQDVVRAALPQAADAAALAPPERPRAPWRRRARRLWASRESILLLAMIGMAAATQAANPGFLEWSSVAGILSSAAPLAAAAAGMTLVIAAGAIDLSVGSILALSGLCWTLWARAGGGLSTVVGLSAGAGIAMAAGALLGLLNSLLSIALRVHPIVVTLGTMGILRGLFLLSTGGDWLELPEAARALAQAGPLGVPVTAWLAAALIAAAGGFLRWRIEGREILALGDNPHAARTHGLRVRRARIAAFLILGGATGLAAVLHTSRYGGVQSNTGLGFELEVIAAAVIGGASIGGGRGTAGGAALGALFLALLADVRRVWGIHERWQLMAVGLIMLAVIGLEKLVQRALGDEA